MQRLLLSRRWLVRHAVAVVLIGACLRLAWWQLDRAWEAGGDAQNLGYALQWPFFGVFVGYVWFRMLQLELRQSAPSEPPAAGSTVPAPDGAAPDGGAGRATAAPRTVPVRRWSAPATVPVEPPDEELAAYNRYLASLDAASSGATPPRRTSTPSPTSPEDQAP